MVYLSGFWGGFTLLSFFVAQCQATEQLVTVSATAGHAIPKTLCEYLRFSFKVNILNHIQGDKRSRWVH